MSVEKRAVQLATDYYRQQGYTVFDVSHSRRPEHGGFDLLLTRGAEQLRIEVKGCSREWQIPDPYCTEFAGEPLQLVADVLAVVYLEPNRRPRICEIPRDAISPDDLTEKRGYRLSSRLKKRGVLEPYTRYLDIEVAGTDV